MCPEEKIDINRFKIIAEHDDVNCVNIAVRMMSQGEGDILMKELVMSDKYVRGILIGLVPPKGIKPYRGNEITHVPLYYKVLLVSDVAVIPYPVGIAYNVSVCEYIDRMVAFIEPISVMPGENEMEALAENAIMVLKGDIEPSVYS